MDDDWEQIADNIEKGTAPPKNPNINKWDGEDEEEDVKDSWEDDEEKKDEEKVEVKPAPKPKKTLQKKIEEKERLEEEELNRLEQEKLEAMTPEEQLAEKLRIEKAQKESDLKNAQDLLGVGGERLVGEGIDAMVPTNKAEFTELADAISRKVATFKAKEEFPVFVEDLVRNLCVHLMSTDLKKVKSTVDNLYTEKQKMEKEKSKKGKAKSRAKLRYDGDTQSKITDYGYEEFDDYDDFM
uniref:Eukaryotic translation initiation factor 3 subunit J n=1 Tax=Nyssomyia neivai TaxID=330878 RepID=A0A1L8DSP8_9DIPT